MQSPLQFAHVCKPFDRVAYDPNTGIPTIEAAPQLAVNVDGLVECTWRDGAGASSCQYGYIICRPTQSALAYVELEVHDAFCRGEYCILSVGVIKMAGLDLDSMCGHRIQSKISCTHAAKNTKTDPKAKAGDSIGLLYNSTSGTCTHFENGKMVRGSQVQHDGEWCICLWIHMYGGPGFPEAANCARKITVRVTAKRPPQGYAIAV
jgi:hypothetical protein